MEGNKLAHGSWTDAFSSFQHVTSLGVTHQWQPPLSGDDNGGVYSWTTHSIVSLPRNRSIYSILMEKSGNEKRGNPESRYTECSLRVASSNTGYTKRQWLGMIAWIVTSCFASFNSVMPQGAGSPSRPFYRILCITQFLSKLGYLCSRIC